MLAMWVWYSRIGELFANSMKSSFSLAREDMFDPARMLIHLQTNILDTGLQVLPFLLFLLVLGLAGPVLLGGWSLSAKAMAPKLDRINPLKGLKRMFSAESLMELFKAIAKVLLVGLVAWLCLNYSTSKLLLLDEMPVLGAIVEASKTLGLAALLMSLTMLVIAAIDVPFQIHQHTQKLKMTLEEVKKEMKQSEGSPEMKGRVRQRQREFAQARMMSDIPTADVVITNPTHFSVALKYAADGSGAPVVVAKGADLIAFKIREVASANDVTIVEVPPLARAIYFTTDIGFEIPDKLYLAVAQILAYVFQLKQHSLGKKPVLPDVDVPQELRFDEHPDASTGA